MSKTVTQEEPKRLYSNPGTMYKQDIEYKYNDKLGYMEPFFGEKYNLYEKIQLAKSTVDLDMIIKRAKAGDMSVLNVRQANYADVSEIPDNINDLNALENSISDSFNKLDPNVRALFGNDVSAFANAVSNGSYIETINNYVSALNSKTEVKEGDANV